MATPSKARERKVHMASLSSSNETKNNDLRRRPPSKSIIKLGLRMMGEWKGISQDNPCVIE